MYGPSTLSCAWPCGALALGAGPPLPPVVAIDSTLSLPTIVAVGGVANTGAPVGQGYHAPRLDLRRRRRPRSGIWCHSPGSSSMTRLSRAVRRELRANVARFDAPHRRTPGVSNSAPK